MKMQIKGFNENYFPKDWIILSFFILLNLILKLLHISETPYWLDESHFVFEAQKSLKAIIDEALNYPNSPLYVVMLGGWVKLFGISEFSTRSLSLLFHIFSIPLLYYFAKKYINKQAAIIVILLFTFSNIHLYYSHEARSYTIITFFTIFSFYYFLNLMQKPDWIKLSKYSLVNTVLLYTQVVPIFAIFSQFLVSLFHVKNNRKSFIYFILANLIAVTIFSVWIIFNRYYKRDMAEAAWLSPPDLSDIFLVMVRFLNTRVILFIFLLILLLFFIKEYKKISGKEKNIFWLTISWSFVPIISVFALSLFIPRFLPRYMLLATPGIYLLFAFIVTKQDFAHYFKLDKRYNPIIQWGLILIVIFLSIIKINLNPYKGEAWDKAAEYVKTHETDSTITAVQAWYMFRPFAYYYKKEYFKETDSVLTKLKRDDVIFGNSVGMVKKINLGTYNKLIIVQSHENVVDPKGTVLSYLNENFRLIDKKNLGGICVARYHLSKPTLLDSIFINFEQGNYNNPKFVIQHDEALSGSHVTRVDSKNKYSSGLEIPVSLIPTKKANQVFIQAWVKYSDPAPEAKLVASFENKDDVYLWKSEGIMKGTEANIWNKIKLVLNIPKKELSASDIFKVYLWNKGETEVLVDNILIKFLN